MRSISSVCVDRQAEAQMDRGQQPRLDRLVGAADHRLERRDHVADDVFRRVVQQDREPRLAVEARPASPAPPPRPAACAGRPRRYARRRSGRSSARRGRARARCPRSRRRAARGRAGRAGGPTACAARRGRCAVGGVGLRGITEGFFRNDSPVLVYIVRQAVRLRAVRTVTLRTSTVRRPRESSTYDFFCSSVSHSAAARSPGGGFFFARVAGRSARNFLVHRFRKL